MFHSVAAPKKNNANTRRLRMESLESRYMLSHPTVTAVNVSSTEWAESFVAYLESSGLGTGGYAIPVGSSAQLNTLPWTNINQVKITFSEDVKVEASDLSISGVNTTAYSFSGFNYNSTTYTATWTLSSSITRDKLLLDLDADGMDPVCSTASNEVLDGTWVNGVSTYSSGSTTGGTDFEFRINALPGDSTANNTVNILDMSYVMQRNGKTVADSGYSIFADVNGSGDISSLDTQLVQARVGSTLPTTDPVGMSDDAPTTAGIDDISVDIDATDYVLALTDLFEDAETAPANLSYSVASNTNSDLFDSLTINAAGELVMDFDSTASGDATLTIRATDASGLIVETTVTVHISDAPLIGQFTVYNEIGNYWTIVGVVSDTDDSVEGYVVTFGGVLAAYNLTAVVQSDGSFTITVDVTDMQEGIATAVTTDPHGVASNSAMCVVTTV